jgi:hypothetical protein
MITKEQALELLGQDKPFYIVDKGIEVQNFKYWTSIRITKTRAPGSEEYICHFIKAENAERYINLDIISMSKEEAVENFLVQVTE